MMNCRNSGLPYHSFQAISATDITHSMLEIPNYVSDYICTYHAETILAADALPAGGAVHATVFTGPAGPARIPVPDVACAGHSAHLSAQPQ
jgi:hypothetical protein